MEIVFLTGCVGGPQDKKIYRPIGAYQTAWYLREYGYNVQVIDFIHRIPEEEIYKALKKFITSETKILAYGAMISVIAPESQIFIKKVERILSFVRKNYPWVSIVAGGPANSLLNRIYRNRSLFDYLLFGHSEDTLLALANYLCKGGPPPQYEKLEGNRIIRESFPMPIEKKFDIQQCNHRWDDKDFIQPGEVLPLELGRGCIFKCRFCQYPYIGKNKNDFTRDIQLVIDEINYNYKKWGVTNYYMLDDTFNADTDRLKMFAEAVKLLDFKINYACYLRLDLIHAHPETEDLLLESGLKGAYFGIESFHPEASALVGKPWIAKKGQEYLKYLYHEKWNREINIHANFICGIPPETYDDCLETHKWLVENDISHWQWSPLQISRDSHNEFTSEFDRNSEKYGFSWVLNNGQLQWKTDYCDSETAADWRHKLNSLRESTKLGCWDLLEIANFGFDVDQIKHLTRKEIPWSDVNERRISFLKNYWKQLMLS